MADDRLPSINKAETAWHPDLGAGKTPLLQIRNLSTVFPTERGIAKAVDNVSLNIEPGSVLGIVGESGCGKSVTALSILRLVPAPGRIAGGEILLNGQDLFKLKESQMQEIRGNKIAFIPQDPMTALNPVYTIGEQIIEAIELHQKVGRKQARERAIAVLNQVKLPEAAQRIDEYPHQFSGGMRQRVMIAMALSCKPDLLIADEPTTALDVTVQAQILDLLRSIQRDQGMSIILITHDMGVVAEMCDTVAVMYAGSVVEQASVQELFANPLHPYTTALLNSIPRPGVTRLAAIEGQPPDLANLPKGCRFADRCPLVEPRSREAVPALEEKAPGHFVRCVVVASRMPKESLPAKRAG